MAKNSIRDYSATASSNTDIQSIDIDENCAASGINNAIREIMADTADFVSGTVGIDVLSLADDDNSHQIKIQAPSAVTTTTTFTLPDGDGDAYQVLKTDGSGTLGWVNVAANPSLIINGAMQVAQRGTSTASVTGFGYHSSDRFKTILSSAGTFTVSQSTEAPDGFQYSHKYECTTADASLSANDYNFLQQSIEGQNLYQLQYGNSNAETVTVSFWVRSDKTGTYNVELRISGTTNYNAQQYTISASDTWEKKVVTFVGSTANALSNTNNNAGLELNFWLGAGSTYSGGTTQGNAWHTTANARAADNVNLADTVGNEWYITGVKLEVGSTATDFFHRSYGEELALCQRYFQYFPSGALGRWTNSTLCEIANAFPVRMRAVPTNSINPNDNTAFIFRVGISVNACTISGVNSVYMAETGGIVQTTVSSTASTPSAGDVAAYDTNGDSNVIFCDAEL